MISSIISYCSFNKFPLFAYLVTIKNICHIFHYGQNSLSWWYFLIFFNESACFSGNCGFNLTDFRGESMFTSPNYPNEYENNLKCIWNIEARSGYRIYFEINGFVLEGCCDYLRVSKTFSFALSKGLPGCSSAQY